jgi:4-nitrophenyl phosphatase
LIDLSEKKLFLFDLDGVFYKGKERPTKIGGTSVVEKIRRAGKKLFILTNNSTDTTEEIHGNLASLGIPVLPQEILTTTRLTAEYIAEKYGKVTYHLIGEKGLDEELRKAGLRRTYGARADVLVVGLDRRLTYRKLDMAVRAVRNGADIIATHKARLYMSRDGPAIAVGPIVKAIEYATRKRAVSIGKPSPLMFQMALQRAGCKEEEAVMIGDQFETDISGAARLGIASVLVLTGVDKRISGRKILATVSDVDELAKYI